MEWHRRVGNWVLTSLVNIAFGGRYSDLCYGYNAFWTDTLPSLALTADGFEIETLMGIRALRARLEIGEVPSFECPRIHGSSNLQAIRDGWRILRTIITERLRPYRPIRPPVHRLSGVVDPAPLDMAGSRVPSTMVRALRK
jgi:hypothetical protein